MSSSNNSRESQDSRQSLANFVRELSSTLQELNGSVLSMTKYIVDGVINQELLVALEAASLRSPITEPVVEEAEPFVVVPASEQPKASSDSIEPAEISNASSTHTPPRKRWYAITVGRDPGIFQGAHHVTPNISHIKDGLAIRCRDAAHAIEEFDKKLHEGKVKRVELIVKETPISVADWYEP